MLRGGCSFVHLRRPFHARDGIPLVHALFYSQWVCGRCEMGDMGPRQPSRCKLHGLSLRLHGFACSHVCIEWDCNACSRQQLIPYLPIEYDNGALTSIHPNVRLTSRHCSGRGRGRQSRRVAALGRPAFAVPGLLLVSSRYLWGEKAVVVCVCGALGNRYCLPHAYHA